MGGTFKHHKKSSIDPSDVERLKEIQESIYELLDEALNTIRMAGSRTTYERSRAYWFAHAQSAITHEGEFVNTYDYTLTDAIKELEQEMGPEEEPEEGAETPTPVG